MAATYFSTMLDHLLDIAWSPIRDFNNCLAYIDGISERVIEDDGGGDEVGSVRCFEPWIVRWTNSSATTLVRNAARPARYPGHAPAVTSYLTTSQPRVQSLIDVLRCPRATRAASFGGHRVSVLDGLRSDLSESVRRACLAAAERIAREQPTQALPTDATIHEFAQWISDSAVPVANANLALHAGDFSIGASRLVGAPDMPDLLEWPHHDGRPLAFLAQIDLASLPHEIEWPVPKRGWLYLFLGIGSDGIVVGDADASAHRMLYFGGDVSELRRRRLPEGVALPDEFKNAAPYSISFELGLSVPLGRDGELSSPWENRFAGLASLDPARILLDSKPKVITEAKDNMFGFPREGQNYDCQFQAAATVAGHGSVMHLVGHTAASYLKQTVGARRPPSPDLLERLDRMNTEMAALLQEAPYWRALLSVGSRLYGGTGRGDGVWHFCWWDAQTLRVLVDERRSRLGDFSHSFIYVTD